MKILETSLYVDDLDTAQEFYTGVLGFSLVGREGDRHVFLKAGDSLLLLFNPEVTSRETGGSVPRHGAIGPGHVAFEIEEAEVEEKMALLERQGVAIEKVIRNGAGGVSIYFRDPAGNSLEFVTRSIWPDVWS